MARPRPTTADEPVLGFAVSAAFHIAIAAASLFYFRSMFDPAQETHAVPVDLITVAEKTNVAPMAPPPPPQLKEQDIQPQVTPQPQPLPRIETELTPLEPLPLPQFQTAEPSPDVTMPKFKVEPERKTARQQSQDFNALLNKLTTPAKTPPKTEKTADRIIQGIGAMNGMTADLADALKSQIYRCWSPPVGAPNANDLVVDFDLQLNTDGTVSQLRPSMGSMAAASANSYTRAAVEAARRATYQCQPYRLPADRYAQWREVNPLRFDPRDAMR